MKSVALALYFVLLVINCQGQALSLKFDHINSENGLPQNTIHGIVKDKHGFMWFGTWSGLCRFDGYKFKVYRYEPENLKSITNNRIHNIIQDTHKDLWIETFDSKTICRYNFETDDFERVPKKNVSRAFLKLLNRWDHYHQIKANYQNYQWKIDPYTNSLVQTYLPNGLTTVISSQQVSRWALNDTNIADFYLDDHNILWVGTYGNGVNKANLNAKPFDYYYHDPLNINSIVDNNVRAICEDKAGNYWIGTRNKGITVVGKDHTYRHLQYSKADVKSINNDQVRKIFCDSRGAIWIGTKHGLDRFDKPGGSISHFELEGLKRAAVFDIMEDRSGDIWIATWKGIYQYKYKENLWVHFNPAETVRDPRTRVILEDHKGQLWVGTDGGGISILKRNGADRLSIVRQFSGQDTIANTIRDGRIYSIMEDKAHYVWIGTANGLERYDPATSSFKHFAVNTDESADQSVSAILEDDNGSIWVSHKKGISQLNKQTFKVANYSLQDGLQANEFEESAAFKSKATGRLYFGGSNGYNGFYPRQIAPDRTMPKIVFTELQILNKPVDVNEEVNGRVILKKPIYLTTQLELTHRDKSIALEFSGLQYANPAGNKYAYMLEGFDKNWIYTDASRRFATYSNLAPGDYIFKVKASNSEGVWNPKPATLKITVIPALWASNIAYIFYTLVFCCTLYIFYYYSARFARMKSTLAYESIIYEKELELHKNKIEFFTNISHEIKTPLSLILAPIDSLMAYAKSDAMVDKQLRTMKNNGDRLLKLINQLLDIRRFETGNDKLVLEENDLISFVGMIVDSFRQFAQQRHISLDFLYSAQSFYLYFDRDKVEKILYNLLSNAFKFTHDGGRIQVKISHSATVPSGAANIEVIDNGSGIIPNDFERIFKPFQQGSMNKTGGTGLGLAYSKALAELHGGSISVFSGTGSGADNQTCFTLVLPIRNTEGNPQDIKPLNAEKTLLRANANKHFFSPVQKTLTGTNGKKQTLLLVEDNYEMRQYLKEYLEERYIVLEAQNGVEGLEMSVKHFPDLLISDVMMPEMDGIELCSRIKSDIITSHIPVILLTARSPIEYQIEGLETGADEYLTKPFNLTLLALKIRNLLRNRALLRERYKQQVTFEPSSLNATSPDEKLLKKMFCYVEDRIGDADLNIEEICDSIGMSRTNLYRKMKSLTGLSMAEFIKELRLKRAAQLLSEKKFNVNEVCYMVGFTDPDYFRKCFKAAFGLAPSEYAKKASQLAG